jgi:Zn-dependent membrane protease YugP
MFYGGYGLYLLFSLPALLLGLYAQYKVQGAYKKYSQVRNMNGFSGAQVARRILDSNGLYDVAIEEVGGLLSDHYDPRKRILGLSPQVFKGDSIASAGIAAHEAGHALQHKDGYGMLSLRTAMVPTVQIGSWIGPVIFLIGLLLNSAFGDSIAWIGVFLFGGTALFALITLPVELNATHRAKEWLTNTGMIYRDEMPGVNRVLDAAALTYIAGAIQALSTVLYYVFLLSGRSRD